MNTIGAEASGFVEIAAADIELALEALKEEQTLAACRCGQRLPEGERAQHEATGLWIGTWIGQFSAMEPGRFHFGREDLQRLRGILFSGYKLRLSRRYRAAVMTFRPSLSIGKRLQQMEEFERRMWNPDPSSGSAVCLERAAADRATRNA